MERSLNTSERGVHCFAFDAIQGDVTIVRECIQPGLDKLRVTITNRTPRSPQCDSLLQSLVSAHTILTARQGQFVSLSDPPECFREAAANCRNIGTWRGPSRASLREQWRMFDGCSEVATTSAGNVFEARGSTGSPEGEEFMVKQVCVEYTPEAAVGDYVLVHVGFALSRIDQAEAERTYKLLEELGQLTELEDDRGAA